MINIQQLKQFRHGIYTILGSSRNAHVLVQADTNLEEEGCIDKRDRFNLKYQCLNN
ncbi:MAG: hypothetical protein PUP92_09645 [Rhizonema sp. PD38]|nr:hypothetical protein [Rhizonema sp. PD38]